MKTIYSFLTMLLCMAFTNAAFAQDGNLDTGFDTDGIVLAVSDTALAATDRAFASAIQTDGKLLVCGDAVNGANGRYFLMRFNTNGSLDNSFGTDGVLRGFIGASTSTTGSVVRFLSSGKILLAGTTTIAGEQRWYVTRLNPNGSTDTTFGVSGTRIIDFDAAATVSQRLTDLKISVDGKLVLSGDYSTSVNRFWMLARLNADGSFDNSFSGDGLYGIPTGIVSGSISEVVLTPDNKILTTGRMAIAGAWYPGIIRITNNGLVDSTFSGDGVEFYTIPGLLASEAFGMEIGSDRTILLAGIARNVLAGNNSDNMFVLKVNANGGLISTFGTSGIATFDLVGSLQDQAYQLRLLTNGKIVVAGASLRTTLATSRDMAVIRLNSNGSLDNTFGTLAGRTFVDGGGNNEDFGYHVLVNPSGKLVAVGQASVGGKIRALVAQLNGTIAPLVVTSFIPEIKSISKTSVLANSVTLSCAVNPGAISTSTVFQVSTSATFGSIVNSITTATGSGVSDTTVTSTIVGLSPGVPYYARAISSNINGNDTSATVSFLFNNILPSDSLSLWLRSDLGITTSNGSLITSWADLSSKSNDVGIAPGISQPTIVSNVINGFPVVRFDGTNDFLTSTKNLDVRNGPSVFVVTKNDVRKDYNALLKLSATHTQTSSQMELYWQAGTSGNGNLVYVANRPTSGFGGLAKSKSYANIGTANTYYLASFIVPSNIEASGYYNGDSLTNGIDGGTGVFFPQIADLAHIGVIPGGASFLDGDIAEMIIYNRPLSQTERLQVELYLANRYNLSLGYVPTASLDTFSNLTATSITLRANVTPKSLGTNYLFEVSTSPNFTSPISSTTASLAASATASLVSATISGLSSGTIYYYRTKLTNAAGTFYSNIGAFKPQTQIPTNGMRTWISADQAVETTNQKVTGIYDLAEPRLYTSTDTATAPSLVTNVLNGKPVLRYDGSNDVLTGNRPLDLRTNLTTVIVFKNRVRKSYNGLFRIASALTGETSNLEIFSDGGGTGNGLQFISVNRASNSLATLETSSSGNTFPVNNYYVWVEQKFQIGNPAVGSRLINNNLITQTLGGTTQSLRTPNFINTPYIGIGYNGTAFAGNKYLDGDIAEVIAYNRVLTAQELSQLHAYLEQKYSLGILKPALSNLSVTKQGGSNTFLASSFTIDNRGVSGSYQVQYSSNKFSTFDTLARQFYTSAQSSFTAQIPAPLKFTVYQVRVVASNAFGTDTLSREAMSPFANFDDSQIQGWYRSDGGVVIGTTAGKVQRWINLRNSGSVSNDLEALLGLQEPSLQTNAINTHPALEFNGATTSLRSNALVNLGFFTISIVFKATGGLVYEHGTNTNFNDGSYLNSTNGNTIMVRRSFDRSTKNLAAGWATNNTYRIVTHVFTGSHASHNLYVNGQLMSMTNGPFTANPGASADATLFLGSRNAASDFMTGQIAEVIINNAQIASSGLDSLHAYLAQRYNIGIVTGIEQEPLQFGKLEIYPNPAQNTIQLATSGEGLPQGRLEIYSLEGRLIQVEEQIEVINGVSIPLSIEQLSPGTYMLILHSDKGVLRRKLIKE